LLIERRKGDYAGLLGLPGGKIEKSEHVSEAAVREIEEEAGILAQFKEHVGFVSEKLVENGVVAQHCLIHVCALESESTRVREGSEGSLCWVDLDSLPKGKLIPSDLRIIERMIQKKEKQYIDCVLEKHEDAYMLKKFG